MTAPAGLPPLLGRAELVAGLELLLDGEPVPRGMHVRGVPGSGRSRWCTEVAQRSRRAGRRVIEVAGQAAEQLVELGVVHDLAAALGVPADRSAAALGTALAAALGEQATTLVVDDLSWADAPSKAVLHRAFRLATGDLVLATAADLADPTDPWPDDHLALTPLSDRDIGALVTACAPTPPRSRALHRLIAWSDGSPRTATTLAALITPAGSLAGVAERLAGRYRHRLDRLTSPARRLVVIAAFAEDRGVERVASAAGLSPAEARELLLALPHPLQVVVHDEVHFRTPVLDHGIRLAATAAEADAARTALLSSAGLAELLRHRAALSRGPDSDLARELLATAYAQISHGLLATAITLADAAVGVAADPDQRCAALLAVAEAAVGLGELETAARALTDARPATPRQRAEHAVIGFRAAFERGGDCDADLAAAVRTVRGCGSTDQPAAHADLLAELSTWGSYLAARGFRFAQMPGQAEQAQHLAAQVGSREVRAMAAGTLAVAALFSGHAPDVELAPLRAALAETDPDLVSHPVLDPHFLLATCHWMRGDLDAGHRISAARAAHVLRTGDLAYGGFHVALAYLTARATGRIAACGPLLDAVRRRALEYGHDTADGLSLMVGYVRALDGADPDTAALLEPAVLELAVEGTGSQREILALFGEAIAEGWQIRGHSRPAVDLLREHVEMALATEVPEPVLRSSVVAGAEAAVLAGDLDLAERWLAGLGDDEWTHRPHVDGPRQRVHGLYLAARGDETAGLRLTERAADIATAAGLLGHRARATWAQGHVLRRARRRREAVAAFERAAAEFERAGLLGWREHALADAARVGVSAGGSGLSAAQRQAADLAASGATNAEIAARLSISPRTVESHLAAAYRKLGIRRRGQLALALSADPPIQ